MKYKIGDRVTHFTGINGMIVGLSIDNNTYEFVYLNGGELKCNNINECEIDRYTEDNKIGFSKKKE